MKKYLYIIFAWALTMSLTSCEDDDQSVSYTHLTLPTTSRV